MPERGITVLIFKERIMKLNKKKGFTIVELVIVIAIIAILAAVLIPTFASLIRKANESADIQACRQMNTYLAVNEVTEGKSILEVYRSLKDGGMSAKDYRPLVTDRYFFWDSTLNRIVYTDAGYKVLFPEDSTAKQDNGWYSLTQEIKEEDYTKGENNTIEITKAGQLAKLSKDLKTDKIKANEKLTIKIAKDIDMMGASFNITTEVACEITITADSEKTITGLVNTNYTALEMNNVGVPTCYGDKLINVSNGSAGVKININNITFKGISLGGTSSSDVALISAKGGTNNESKIELTNVKITDSTFMGSYRIAGFVAHSDIPVTMTSCSIENSTLTASVGAVAPIFSMLTTKGTFTAVTSTNNTVTCTNTNSKKVDSPLTIEGWTVKLPADGIMTNESAKSRWYPAKSAFGIYGATILTGGGTVNENGQFPLASGGLDCVETMEEANNYTFNTNRKSQ